MSLLNVVIINDVAHITGGTAQVALSSAIALAKKGHLVTVFSAVAPIMPELNHPNLQVINLNQYEIVNDPIRKRAAVQGIWNLKASQQLADLLNTLDPSTTVLHVHGWTKALSASVIRQAIKKKFRVVLTLHDYFFACPNGGFFNYRRQQICPLKPLSRACVLANCDVRSYPQKLWRVARQAVQNTFGQMLRIKHFITISELSETILRPYLPINSKIHRISNMINIKREKFVDVSHNSQFTFVGVLSPHKGVGLFAKAACQLGCDVTFVGDGRCRGEISSIYPRANITGWVSNSEVHKVLKSARVLVFPSLWYENQPLVVPEAAALGIPAIVADTSAAREMVRDGVTGLWFRGNDEVDLLKKMRILQDHETARKMGHAAYQKYWANPLTMEKHLAQLESCYQDILSETG
ncbi:MAG: glycosyltransferase family 1 protein [Candidatus Parabeggiatoa sp. nov. 1]|nr:MAG: glycosyltransferase family 1 protein [Gammaproteobacteria bacterium]